MTTGTHPEAATLHLGGQAWAHPTLEPRLQDISTVTPYPGNPRRGDQDAITASIRDLGLYAGVITQASTGHVLVGNHRLHALRELGAERLPVDTLDVDDTRAAAIVARDNLTSARGTDDPEALLSLLTPEDVFMLSGYAEQEVDDLRRLLAVTDTFTPITEPGTRLDQLDERPCPKCGYDTANDPENHRVPR